MPSERIQRRIDSLLDEADEAVRRLDWPVVRERALAVLAMDPDNDDARFYLTTADRGQGASSASASSTSASAPASASVVQPAPVQTTPVSFADGRYAVLSVL